MMSLGTDFKISDEYNLIGIVQDWDEQGKKSWLKKNKLLIEVIFTIMERKMLEIKSNLGV